MTPSLAMATVCLTFDVDAEAGLAARLDAHRDRLSTLSEREFSVRRGVPRILDLLGEHSLLATFYVAMVSAALVVEVVFQALGLVPEERNAKIVEASVTWNYTTVLNIIFLLVAGALVLRFIRTGGLPMLRMMDRPTAENA